MHAACNLNFIVKVTGSQYTAKVLTSGKLC